MSKEHYILIAEDDPFLSKVASMTFLGQGYKVDTATDGKTAVDMIEKNPYDVVLLDLIMPKMTGFEVLETLKKKNIKTPVLVFTNLAQEDDKKEVLSLGAKGYYVKADISLDELLEIIRSYLKSK